MTDYTDEDLCRRYIELRDYKSSLEKKKTEIQGLMDIIEAEVLSRLIDRKSEGFKTESGTVYKTYGASVTTLDKSAFQEFVLRPENLGMLDARPLKEGVLAYHEINSSPPPGLSVRFITGVNFRKP